MCRKVAHATKSQWRAAVGDDGDDEKGISYLKGAVATHFQLIIIIWYLSPVLLNFLFFKRPEIQLLSKNLLFFLKKTILGLNF